MMRKARFYTMGNGESVPMVVAQYDLDVTVYKSDYRVATIGDPTDCVGAKGIMRIPGVIEVFVGAGKDAYVVFEGKDGDDPHAVHFTIPASAAKIRDNFDTKGAPKTQILKLRAPTKWRTHEARAVLNKNRREAIKAGSPVKHRGRPNTTRITRIGVPHRPKPQIVKGAVQSPELEATS